MLVRLNTPCIMPVLRLVSMSFAAGSGNCREPRSPIAKHSASLGILAFPPRGVPRQVRAWPGRHLRWASKQNPVCNREEGELRGAVTARWCCPGPYTWPMLETRTATLADAALIAAHRRKMFASMGGFDESTLDAVRRASEPWTAS